MKNLSAAEQPTFNSLNLIQALKDVSDVFDNHQRDIDSVSNDIKSLEAYIKSKNVQIPFQQSFHLKNSATQYILKWDKFEQSKDLRLLCQVCTHDFEEGTCSVTVHDKPLIEHSLSVRMDVYPFLPKFIKSLAAGIKIFTRETPVQPEESDSFQDSDLQF